jgi:hypothetical protein
MSSHRSTALRIVHFSQKLHLPREAANIGLQLCRLPLMVACTPASQSCFSKRFGSLVERNCFAFPQHSRSQLVLQCQLISGLTRDPAAAMRGVLIQKCANPAICPNQAEGYNMHCLTSIRILFRSSQTIALAQRLASTRVNLQHGFLCTVRLRSTA